MPLIDTLYLILPETIGEISPHLYGHFTEHIGGVFYDGLWVGEEGPVPHIRGFRKHLVEKLRGIRPPVIRWPGGCFAETYDWRDGIGPREKRPTRLNWWTAYDGRYEPNAVGTHEFIDLCRLVGAEPYIAANMTTADPLLIRNWVDYCNSPRGLTSLARLREENGSPEPFGVHFWGVGNENWGDGGDMTPEGFAHEFRKYSVVLNNADTSAELFACGPNGADYEWTRKAMEVMQGAFRGGFMSGFSQHYYCGQAGDPIAFTAEEWDRQIAQAQRIEEILRRQWAIIQGFGMEKKARLVVDEWGCWHPEGSGPSKGKNLFEQQSTMRDAVVSALTLNVFNNHCDKVRMANVAQLVNNLHCLFLAEGDRCIETPTYHVFDMMQPHKGGTAFRALPTNGKISVSASEKDGYVTVTAANLACDEDFELRLCLTGAERTGPARILQLFDEDMHAHNTFENPDRVHIVERTADADVLRLPRAGVVTARFPILRG